MAKTYTNATVLRPWSLFRVQLWLLFWGCWRFEYRIVYRHINYISWKWLPIAWSVEYLEIRWESGEVIWKTTRPGADAEVVAMEAQHRALQEKYWRIQ